MKNFTKVLVFLFVISFFSGLAFSEQEKYLSSDAVQNTVQTSLAGKWFKTNSGQWGKVPVGTTNLKSLSNAKMIESDVLHRPSGEEPFKHIYEICNNKRRKDVIPEVVKWYDDPNPVTAINVVDESTKKYVIEKVKKEVGTKDKVVVVTQFTKTKVKKTEEEKWRYRTRRID